MHWDLKVNQFSYTLLSQGRWNDRLANIGVYEIFFFLMLLVFYFVSMVYFDLLRSSVIFFQYSFILLSIMVLHILCLFLSTS